MPSVEIDEGVGYAGFQEALAAVHVNVSAVGVEVVPLESAVGRIPAEDLVAPMNTPSCDISLKDGFAVKSEDVAPATSAQPVRLQVVGEVHAGSYFDGAVSPGTTVKVLSGSPLPKGATAVVSEEFCREAPGEVLVSADAQPGRNVLKAGEDIEVGAVIAERGRPLHPGRMGLLAASAFSRVKAYRRPKVAIIAIGDEVVAPGAQIKTGQVYASNLVVTGAWLAAFGIQCDTAVVRDDREEIRNALAKRLPGADVVLTSGGTWRSERDLVVRLLDDLGWRKVFHRVRMGPGKGVAFGLWEGKTMFCLPGGPPSNEMAFLQLALPGILRMAGYGGQVFQTVQARLTRDLRGRHPAWTEFVTSRLFHDSSQGYTVTPSRSNSRLSSIADTSCLVAIPESVELLRAGDVVAVQLLAPTLGALLPTIDLPTIDVETVASKSP